MDLSNNRTSIPSVKHHSLYISFWKKIYDDVKHDQIIPDKVIITQYKRHLAKEFEKLRHIKDDDFFEWNHAMIVYLVISMCELKTEQHNNSSKQFDVNDEGQQYQTWLKKNQMLTIKNRKNKLSTIMLLIDHIDDRWGHFDLEDIHFIQTYIEKIYLSASEYVHNAGDLTFYDRWNLIDPIDYKNLYRVRNVLIMQLACKQAFQTRNIVLGNLINTFHTSSDIQVSEHQERQFIRWAEKEKTYFSIRKFRTRITQVIWRFLDNLPSRWLHTYKKTGEEPTVYSHVSGKYPSSWINSINHNVLYSEPAILLNSSNPLIHEATVFALVEAYFRTLHNFNWTSYCFCNDFDIINNNTALRTSKFPLIIRYWKKFAVVFQNKLYKTETIVKSLLFWLKIIKRDCNYIILENINLFNTYNTMIPNENQAEGGEENCTVKQIGNRHVFEINL